MHVPIRTAMQPSAMNKGNLTLAMRLFLLISVTMTSDILAIRTWSQGNEGRVQLQDTAGKNPIRKVVTLLEDMAKKVEQEKEKEQELYDKFQCYCQKGQADLQKSINDNDAKVPAVQSDIEEAEATVAKLKEDLKQHQINRESAKKAMAEADALRETEHAKYVKESTEVKEYSDSLASAIPAIESGMAGTRLLQMKYAVAVKRAAVADQQLTYDDRDSVVSFLSGSTSSSNGYTPSSNEIVGILKEMKADYDKDLAALTNTEEEAAKLHNDLIAAKTKEVKTLGEQIEKKTSRVGELQVDIVNMKHDLSESEAMLIADQKFLKDMETDCQSKGGEHEERKKVRGEELQAIYETIKILNDDDALDIFKKTLPTASAAGFVQMNRAKMQALSIMRRLISDSKTLADHPEIRFLEMALIGRKVDFSKVVKMVDDMVALLKEEQADDDFKVEYCNKQIDEAEDRVKELKKSMADLEQSVEEKASLIEGLAGEVKTLQNDIRALDKLVADADADRKANNAEFTELMSTNTEAKQLLEFAKNRLNKFYNPEMYKPEPKEETVFTEEEEASSYHAEPAAAPATWNKPVEKKAGESNKVLSMLDLLIRDLSMEMVEAEKDEEHQQQQYEELLNDSASKRAKMIKAISVKNEAKAENEEIKTTQEGSLAKTSKELNGVAQYEMNLHGECDWLLQNYDLRKTARADEADNLKSAKAVLMGADFSLVQVSRAAPLLRQRRQ